ncbi:hypothetical protein AAFX91_18985 [Bradyrhizobium sp. 31Argb]|uniref:hypothetical protein n=1 Tax=Bradyrhizobium sp. 31Argb TaxID=3141247 RepID=UPI003748EB4B
MTTRKGWALWAAVAYRNDRPTARIAYVIANKLESQEIKAPSCLFTRVDQLNCLQSLVAEAFGSGELGLPTGSGSAADHKVETFHNKQTGKATLKLDNRVFRTFDNAKGFLSRLGRRRQRARTVRALPQACDGMRDTAAAVLWGPQG